MHTRSAICELDDLLRLTRMQEAAETALQVSSTLRQQPGAAAGQLPQSAAQAFHQCTVAASATGVCGSGSKDFLASVIGEAVVAQLFVSATCGCCRLAALAVHHLHALHQLLCAAAAPGAAAPHAPVHVCSLQYACVHAVCQTGVQGSCQAQRPAAVNTQLTRL